jgi:AcrR family transcriptional regulator
MGHSRTDVVAAALRVLDEQGLEFCSMRRVAAALDVQPSALYHHVPDKQTLLALMADEMVSSVRGSGPAELCRDLRRAMLAVRDGADVVATASAYRLGASAVEARLAELLRERFDDMTPWEAVESARTLLHFVFGHTQSTQMLLQAQEFAALAAGRPADAAADPPGASRADLEASFDRGIAVILAGLAVRLELVSASG